MLEWLKMDGVQQQLPVAVAILIIGWTTVKAIITAYNKFIKFVEGVVTKGIADHVAAQHTPNEAFQKEMRELIGELKLSVAAVHRRLDTHIDHGSKEVVAEPDKKG